MYDKTLLSANELQQNDRYHRWSLCCCFQIYRTDLSDLTTSWKSGSFQVGTGLIYSQHETTL